VEFRVLGSLEATADDGTTVAVPRGRASVVLALLLARRAEGMTISELVDAAWNTRPPATAATQLHGFVSALRRVLGRELVITRAGRYQLDVPAGAVDLDRMRGHIGRARGLRAAGDESAAAQALAAALDEWRGRPFSGLDCTELEDLAALIEAEYVDALEEFAQLRLALAQDADLAERLGSWAGEYPLREGLRASQMRVLARGGRQAEALAVYHDVRHRLADELGVDPGPDLQELYQQILAGDRRALSAPVPVPAQIPAGVADFTGRDAAVKELRELLEPGAVAPPAVTVLAVCGTGGIGKSALATHVAHAVAAAYPGGQLYANLAGTSAEPAAPGDVLGRFLRDLGVPSAAVPAGLEERAARYRSLVAGRQVLVFLDDARDTAQVRPLLPGTPGSAVLVTSRGRLGDLDGARRLDLDGMEPQDARRLFAQVVGTERTGAEPQATASIIATCGGLPLAIRIAGARLAARPSWTVESFAGRLMASRRTLEELSYGDLAVRASFRLSYEALPGLRARAFRLLGAAPPGDLASLAAAALLGVSEADAEAELDGLCDVYMLESPQPGWYRPHDLLRLLATELAEREPERSLAVERLLYWYWGALRTACEAFAQGATLPYGTEADSSRVPAGLPSFETSSAALAWCHEHCDNLVWAVRTAGEQGRHDVAVAVARLFTMYGDRAAPVEYGLAVARTGLDSARALGDKRAMGWLMASLGAALQQTGDMDAAVACYEESLAIRKEVGRPLAVGAALNDLATLYHGQGREREALELLEQTEQILREHDASFQLSVVLGNQGEALAHLGSHEAALARYAEALKLSRAAGSRMSEAVQLSGTGEVLRRMGRLAESLDCHRQAIGILRGVGSVTRELATALNMHGKALADSGRTQQARREWREALIIAEELGDTLADQLREALAVG
jgi:DNA-binding SARP family transcriptional activator/tetratricopeptide (TPR) repeat protein